jgi:single-strand DNA-binding protein
MASGLNKVMLIGNLGADPELRFTQGGTGVMNLRLACSESFKDKDGTWQERTEWINVVIWGKRAEGLAKCLTKGSTIYVEGRMQTSKYTDRERIERYKTEVVAANIILCGGKGKPAGDGNERTGYQRPAARSQGRPAVQESASEYEPDDNDGGYGGDDIPF